MLGAAQGSLGQLDKPVVTGNPSRANNPAWPARPARRHDFRIAVGDAHQGGARPAGPKFKYRPIRKRRRRRSEPRGSRTGPPVLATRAPESHRIDDVATGNIRLLTPCYLVRD